MANYLGIYSVGASIVEHLTAAYPPALSGPFPCEFRLLSGEDMAKKDSILPDDGHLVSLFLYRVTNNEHLRHSLRPTDSSRSLAPLALDLHYLVTVWGRTGQAEHVIFAWVLRQLYEIQTLNASTLMPGAGWNADEVVQLIPAELSTEDLMRVWDALEPSYHLTTSYVARVVRIDGTTVAEEYAPVISSRLDLVKHEPGGGS